MERGELMAGSQGAGAAGGAAAWGSRPGTVALWRGAGGARTHPAVRAREESRRRARPLRARQLVVQLHGAAADAACGGGAVVWRLGMWQMGALMEHTDTNGVPQGCTHRPPCTRCGPPAAPGRGLRCVAEGRAHQHAVRLHAPSTSTPPQRVHQWAI